MKMIFGWIGIFALGSLGWWLGDFLGLLPAVMLSAIGSGAGLYWGRKLFDRWLG
jgi:hypothetical protein